MESLSLELRKKYADFMVGIKVSEQHSSSDTTETIQRICEAKSKEDAEKIISKMKFFYCNKCQEILGKDIVKGIRGLLLHSAVHNIERKRSNAEDDENAKTRPQPPPTPTPQLDRSTLSQDVATLQEALEMDGPLQYVTYNSLIQWIDAAIEAIEDKGFQMESDTESTSEEIAIIESTPEQSTSTTPSKDASVSSSSSTKIIKVHIETAGVNATNNENVPGGQSSDGDSHHRDAEENDQTSEINDEPMDLSTKEQPNKFKNKRKPTGKPKRAVKNKKRFYDGVQNKNRRLRRYNRSGIE